MPSETYIEQKAARYAKERGVLLLKLKGPTGWPDRVLIGRGRTCFVEFKAPDRKGRLSPHQKIWIDRLRELGHQVHVVDDYQVAEMIIDNYAEALP